MVQAADKTRLPQRSEVDDKYKWNAESVFATPEAWDAELTALLEMIPRLADYQGKLAEGPAKLAGAYQLAVEIYARGMSLTVYATMSQSVDSGDQQAAVMAGRVGGFFGRVQAAAAFLEPETLALGKDTVDAWVADNDDLKEYEHYFDDLFRKQHHVRSAEVEEVLGLASDALGTPGEVAHMLVNVDMKFDPAVDSQGQEHEVAQATNDGLKRRTDRELRRTAYESYASGYMRYQNTLASNLSAAVKRAVFHARVANHDSALEAALFDDNVPADVFHNLIDTFKQQLPTWHRYWEVKRKALGVDTIHPYDIWAPLTDNPPVVSFEKAIDWLSEALAPLGEEYVSAMRRGCLEDRWVDVYPNVGKREGAFSIFTYHTHPFIFAAYHDTVGSMSTMAHELGHAMHTYMANKYQPFFDSQYSIFVAEVASNFNQALLREYLLKTTNDRDLHIALISEAIENFHRYFFIMPTLARFELETHTRVENGDALNASALNELCADLFAEGYGDTMTYDRDKVGIIWAQFSHLYTNFYVYQYATGISGAHALANRVLNEGESAALDYVNFLKAGASKYPLEVLREAGIDLTTPDPVVETFGVLSDYIDRLEELTA